jgi:non-heme chloroperoxidase
LTYSRQGANDFTPDLKNFTVPTLIMHGDDDQIVPYADSGPLSAKLVKGLVFKSYKGSPHGMPATQADTTIPRRTPGTADL